ncbi:MAG TPA: crossover junction endodeoxyribonuclease RuvC [bacterium]|nr:crossover junction endodeoxyribonuclease RuvC [bacterium]HPN81538.1 crossover junction endodeoxyribonuclease RuvC [bacterium]HPW39544.1 crossover junction endodeoxyribonuclease RuvC [bacterium]
MSIGRQKKIILGIDPGLADTGYGIISEEKGKITLLTCGSIKTPARVPLTKRLEIIARELKKIIKDYQPDKAGIEQLFFCNNAKTAIAVGQARGVALLIISQHKIPLFEYTPLQVKQAVTGYGQADKKQIQQMVKLILNLETVPKPDDAADAVAIAICALNNSINRHLV